MSNLLNTKLCLHTTQKEERSLTNICKTKMPTTKKFNSLKLNLLGQFCLLSQSGMHAGMFNGNAKMY